MLIQYKTQRGLAFFAVLSLASPAWAASDAAGMSPCEFNAAAAAFAKTIENE